MCKVCDVSNYNIAFGEPIVEQIRNPHNLFTDLEDEILNNISTDFFCDMLKNITLTESKPLFILKELLIMSKQYLEKKKAKDDRINIAINKYVDEYLIWTNLIIKSYDSV